MTERTRYWWAIIPGFALIGAAALVAIDQFFPRVGGNLGTMILLGGLGLAFFVIYFQNREYWWAIIPGGVLFTVALIVGLESVFEGDEIVGILFLGLGLTFGVLYLRPSPYKWMKWFIVPAGVLLGMGLLTIVAAIGGSDLLFGAVLIAVGLLFLYRMFKSR
jgi:hypothetical protein